MFETLQMTNDGHGCNNVQLGIYVYIERGGGGGGGGSVLFNDSLDCKDQAHVMPVVNDEVTSVELWWHDIFVPIFFLFSSNYVIIWSI